MGPISHTLPVNWGILVGPLGIDFFRGDTAQNEWVLVFESRFSKLYGWIDDGEYSTF
jgi:hypothetical protein